MSGLFGGLAVDAIISHLRSTGARTASKHVIDGLHDDERTSIFEEMLTRATATVTIRLDAADHQMRAISGGSGLLFIPYLVVPLDQAGSSTNRGVDGFASRLRDFYNVGAPEGEVRILLTLTAHSNETQRSAAESAVDGSLLSLTDLATQLLERSDAGKRIVYEEEAGEVVRHVVEKYVELQPDGRPWNSVLQEVQSFASALDDIGSVDQVGSALGAFGRTFLPDSSETFSEHPGAFRKVLTQGLRCESRLDENAAMRAQLEDWLTDPLVTPEETIGRELSETSAATVLNAGLSGLGSIDLGGLEPANKSARLTFDRNNIQVSGHSSVHRRLHETAQALVLSAKGEVSISVPVVGQWSNQHVHLFTYEQAKRKLHPYPKRARYDAASGRATFELPCERRFNVYVLSVSRGKRSRARESDAITVVAYKSEAALVLLPDDAIASLEEQAWIATGDELVMRVLGVDGDTVADPARARRVDAQPGLDENEEPDDDREPITFVNHGGLLARVGWVSDEEEDDEVEEYEARTLEHQLYQLKRNATLPTDLRLGGSVAAGLSEVRRREDGAWEASFQSRSYRVTGWNELGEEQAVALALADPRVSAFTRVHSGELSPLPADEAHHASETAFWQARAAVFGAAERAWRSVSRADASGRVAWTTIDLTAFEDLIDDYLSEWNALLDGAVSEHNTQFQEVQHGRLLELDVLKQLGEGGKQTFMTLLPTHPWLMKAQLEFQKAVMTDARGKKRVKELRLSLPRLQQLEPTDALDDWIVNASPEGRFRAVDGAPFTLRFVPGHGYEESPDVDYVKRAVTTKISRYLDMHRHLMSERRTLRIGVIGGGDGTLVLQGIEAWVKKKRAMVADPVRVKDLPKIEVLFFGESETKQAGAAFDTFVREQGGSQSALNEFLVGRLSYRRCDAEMPSEEKDFVHMCFVRGLVAQTNYMARTGKLSEGWDGGFGDALLAQPLRWFDRQSTTIRSIRGLWLGDTRSGLRRGLARWMELHNGRRGGMVCRGQASYWAVELPSLESWSALYDNADWVVHLDRELSLSLFAGSKLSSLRVIEYTDQEDVNAPGLDVITVTSNAKPYEDQLAEVLKSTGLPLPPDPDEESRAARSLLTEINKVSGTWALDFLLGGVGVRDLRTRLRGNIGATLAYRWLRQEMELRTGEDGIDYMPVVLSIEDLIRATPNNGLKTRDGLKYRYCNEVGAENEGRFCDDLLVLYFPVTDTADDYQIYGRVVEVKFGVTAFSSDVRKKGLAQVRTTAKLLMKYLGGGHRDAGEADGPFNDRLLSGLVKSQLEQGLAMGVFNEHHLARLDVTRLSARIATGRYRVEFAINRNDEALYGDLFLLSTSEQPGAKQDTVRVTQEEGVGIVRLSRPQVHQLAFEPSDAPTLANASATWPSLGLASDLWTTPQSVEALPPESVSEPVEAAIHSTHENSAPRHTGPRSHELVPPSRRLGSSADLQVGKTSPPAADLAALPFANVLSTEAPDSASEVSALTGAILPSNKSRPDDIEAAHASRRRSEPAIVRSPTPTPAPPDHVPSITPASPPSISAPVVAEPTLTREEAIAKHRRLANTPVKLPPYPPSDAGDAIRRLGEALSAHGIDIQAPPTLRAADAGPRILRAYVKLQPGEKIASVRRISEDVARDVGTASTDIHIGNHPARHSIAFDLPINGLSYDVSFDELRAHPSFDTARDALRLGLCAGIGVTGAPHWVDLSEMPHMLVAGTTGSGKTVFLRTLLLTMALHRRPDELMIRLSSSKPMDFRIFTTLPHAHGRNMAESNGEALLLTNELIVEMDERISKLSDALVDNLEQYNEEHPHDAMPRIVAVLDEFSETVLSFEDKEDRATFTNNVARLAQKARAAGIHLVLCMQRPDATVVQGPIKSNILHRFGLKLPQVHDSRVILDEAGAETLLGKGDLLYKDGDANLHRVQVPFLSSAALRATMKSIIDDAAGDAPASEALPASKATGSVVALPAETTDSVQLPSSQPPSAATNADTEEPSRSAANDSASEQAHRDIDADRMSRVLGKVRELRDSGAMHPVLTHVSTRRIATPTPSIDAAATARKLQRQADVGSASISALQPPSLISRSLEALEVETIRDAARLTSEQILAVPGVGRKKREALLRLADGARSLLGIAHEEVGQSTLAERIEATGLSLDARWRPLLFELSSSARTKLTNAGFNTLRELVDAVESGQLTKKRAMGRRTVASLKSALEVLADPNSRVHHPPTTHEELFRVVLTQLDERQQVIVIRRLAAGHTLEEIGAEFALTRERIRQLEESAYSEAREFYSVVARALAENVLQAVSSRGGIVHLSALGLPTTGAGLAQVRLCLKLAEVDDLTIAFESFVCRSRDHVRDQIQDLLRRMRSDVRSLVPWAEAAAMLHEESGIRLSAEELRHVVRLVAASRVTDNGVVARRSDSGHVITMLLEHAGEVSATALVAEYDAYLKSLDPIRDAAERTHSADVNVRNLLSRSRDAVRTERGVYCHIRNLPLSMDELADLVEKAVDILFNAGEYLEVDVLWRRTCHVAPSAAQLAPLTLRDLLVRDDRLLESPSGQLGHDNVVEEDARSVRQVVRDLLRQSQRPLREDELLAMVQAELGADCEHALGFLGSDAEAIFLGDRTYVHLQWFGLEAEQLRSLVNAVADLLLVRAHPLTADVLVEELREAGAWPVALGTTHASRLIYSLCGRDERFVRGPSLLVGRSDESSDSGVLAAAIQYVLDEMGSLTASEIRSELGERFGFRGTTVTVQRHAERAVEQGELSAAGDYFNVRDSGAAEVLARPAFVASIGEVVEEVARFQSETIQNRVRAWSIVRATIYWVYDATTEKFAPLRIAAYRDMDFEAYARARVTGTYRDVEFDEGLARTTLEKQLGLRAAPESPEQRLSERLLEWADEHIEPDVLADVHVHWRFLTLEPAV